MPPSEIAFDRVVAERLARIADADRRQFNALLECVVAWLPNYAAALIDIAQQGHASMAEAIELSLHQVSEPATLEAVFQALPTRTIQLRSLAVSVTSKLLDAVRVQPVLAQSWLLRSQLSARLRESGKPMEAFEVLKEVVLSPEFPALLPLAQAHLLSNLATSLADIGENRQSFEYHAHVIRILDSPSAEKTAEVNELLLNELGNAAAASLRVQDFPKAEHFIERAEALLRARPDRALSFRLSTIRFTLYAESHNFSKALELGRNMLPLLEDFEEASNDVYRTLLIDALVNVGSVALDEFLNDEAAGYFERALALASGVLKVSDTPQARLKVLTTRLAVLTAKLQQGALGLSGPVRDLLVQSRIWLRENENAYALEVHRRILEVVVRASTEDDQELPAANEIEELLAGEANSTVEMPEEIWVFARIKHTAALAYAKLELRVRALELAQQAFESASAVSSAESIHDRAQRAVLLDSLSRRLEENGDEIGALDRAELALELIEPCWQETDKYRPWVEKMLLRFRGLAERHPEERRLENFLSKRALDSED